mgnify:CR=1 FL=1
MSWPLTPLRTYVAGSTPTIKASDLNDIQDAINDVVGGAITVKSLHADGTGAAAATLPSGSVAGKMLMGNGGGTPTATCPAGGPAGDTGGTPPTPTVTGNNVRGKVVIVTRADNRAAGKLCSVTYAVAYPGIAYPAITPMLADTLPMGLYLDNVTANGFDVYAAVAVTGGGLNIGFTYVVIG